MRRIQSIWCKEKKLAIGLMSGTSLDGVDAALVELHGDGVRTQVKLIHFSTVPYSAEERQQILQLCSPATSSVDQICRMNVVLGKKLAHAALHVVEKVGINIEDIDFISSHGQTIYHLPEEYATLQIGELAVIAADTGCVTVGDFRPSDLAVGGQGAPLVPYVDYLLFRDHSKGRALLNIGGISNVTVLQANARAEDVFAFDMGPGNVLIDALVHIGTKGQLAYDEGGQIASRGHVRQDWLEELLEADQFVQQRPPKSTGRELYTMSMAETLWQQGRSRGFSFEDMVATVTHYTVHAIVRHFKEHIDPASSIQEVFVGGGGVHNQVIMQELDACLDQKVFSMEQLGFSSDAKEAIAFAILGNEFLHGQVNNLPTATGAERQVVMGKLALP